MTINADTTLKGSLPPIVRSHREKQIDPHPLERNIVALVHPLDAVQRGSIGGIDSASTGIHMPLRVAMEKYHVSMPRISMADIGPGYEPLKASNLFLEIIDGKDEILDFEETLGTDHAYSHVYRDPNQNDDLAHLR